MFKKLLSICLVVIMAVSCCVTMSSCSTTNDDFKLGVILLHDSASTYDKNFIEAVERAKADLGLRDDQVIYKTGIPESNAVYDAAADLVDSGCDVIFANSFGHETYLLRAAKEFKDVKFCHATGTMAHTENLDNFHNAFASIYEGRYLAGVAAGLKLNEMIENDEITEEEAIMGYVGAFTYAEVMSGYTSFYLGAKSVCPSVTMKVQFTGSWYNETLEREAATALINAGCVLISQHADSMGAPSVCEDRNVPNISYNVSTIESCPETFIVSSKIDWTPYFKYICEQTMQGKQIVHDWTGTISTGSVVLSDVNTAAAAEGTVEKLAEVQEKLISGEIKVFDIDTFTVQNGQKLESYMADVDTDAAFEKDTQVIEGGYFAESKYRSAPYFDVRIDGIILINEVYDPVEE